MARTTRKFGGKTYRQRYTVSNKAEATRRANIRRKSGWNARVSKSGGDYVVYERAGKGRTKALRKFRKNPMHPSKGRWVRQLK